MHIILSSNIFKMYTKDPAKRVCTRTDKMLGLIFQSIITVKYEE